MKVIENISCRSYFKNSFTWSCLIGVEYEIKNEIKKTIWPEEETMPYIVKLAKENYSFLVIKSNFNT